MSFAFRNIILNQSTLSQSGGRLSIGGVPLAFLSEAAGGVTGLTVESGDARYVGLTGNQTVSGNKTFLSGLSCQVDGVEVYNSSNGSFYDAGGTPSCDVYNRVLSTADVWKIADASEQYIYTSIGHDGRITKDTSSISVGDGNASINEVVKIDWGDGILYGNTGDYAVDWVGGWLYAAGSKQSLNWQSRILWDESELICLDWGVRTLYDDDTQTSLEWDSRKLSSVTGAFNEIDVTLDWQNKILSGHWNTNTVPSSPGHIINKGYLDSHTGLVKTTGAQTISGAKTFKSVAAFDEAVTCIKGLYGYDAIGAYSLDTVNRYLQDSSDAPTVDWESRALTYIWDHSATPTGASNIANKGYVDSVVGASSGVFTLPFGHSVQSTISDSTSYYFGGCSDMPLQTTAANSSVVVNPQSGVLRKVIGNANVAGTLGSSETVSLIVYLNDSPIATGSYQMTGKNNTIVSGLSGINRNISYLDRIYLGTVTPAWGTNPASIRQSAVAYVSLG
jgi:hypothetical protein